MELSDKPWEDIYKRDGRFFVEPAPVVVNFGQLLKRHGCSRVLDLGCGNGRHVLHLAEIGLLMVGMDNSPTALNLTQDWLAEKERRAGLVLGDARLPLPFADGVFDAVLSTQVIHHARLAVVQGTAREIGRVVRQGGLLLVSVPVGIHANEEHQEIELGTFVPLSGDEKGFPHHIFSPGELCRTFEDFSVMEIQILGGVFMAMTAMRR